MKKYYKVLALSLSLVTISILTTACSTFTSPPPDSLGTPTSKNGLDIVSWNTKNGARVLYVNAPQIPMVDVKVSFDAGSARDGKKPGLASMTNNMLSVGAGKWNTNQINERFDDVGTRYGSASNLDLASVSIRSLNDTALLTQSVDTLKAIINNPKFNDAELERLRKQVLISLKNQLQSPASLARKSFYENLYRDHPYAHQTIGNKESVKAIKRKDLLSFYKKYYVAKNALIAIVGDISQKDARALAENLVNTLPSGNKATAIPAVSSLSKSKEVVIPHPSTQTHILVGQPGMKRGDPDYFALYVGNHILGGSGFSSRMMKSIRDERGLAYSSYSYFSPLKENGPFTLGLQTKNDKRKEALQVLHQTLNEFIQNGPSDKELSHAKRNITGGFPLRIDSNRDILGYISMIGFYELPLDYLNTFNQTIESISKEQIRDAFHRRVHPDKLLTILVGKEP